MQASRLVIAIAAAGILANSQVAGAQALYKYVDSNGKVTYSDKAPKPGEKAELVKTDSNVNIMAAPANKLDGVNQKLKDVNQRAGARETERDQLKAELDTAKSKLDQAKKALEQARDQPTPEERRIVVRKDGNSVMLSPEYEERLLTLESAVKQAEENLTRAQEKFRRDSPG
jgi:chromosome segregation ATPase